MEQTYVMLRPDAILGNNVTQIVNPESDAKLNLKTDRSFVVDILKRIKDASFNIKNMKLINFNQEEILYEHYAHSARRFPDTFPDFVKFMMSTPCIAMIVEGKEVTKEIRDLLGDAADVRLCKEGTIRGDFGDKSKNIIWENLMHASDSNETAKKEIERFFGKQGEGRFEELGNLTLTPDYNFIFEPNRTRLSEMNIE